MPWNFKDFPELPNNQLDFYYWQSPHKQLFESFQARVIRVHDADTLIVRIPERNFDFPVRFSNTSARELIEKPERDTSHQLCADGKTSQQWLEDRVIGQDVTIVLKKSRVEKFGRLLGKAYFQGIDLGSELLSHGMAVPWANRIDGRIPVMQEVKI
jgi:endonuclease YncB( thermonuclease family)